jgi:hypothetical protein
MLTNEDIKDIRNYATTPEFKNEISSLSQMVSSKDYPGLVEYCNRTNELKAQQAAARVRNQPVDHIPVRQILLEGHRGQQVSQRFIDFFGDPNCK